eukprot:gene41835-55318_t
MSALLMIECRAWAAHLDSFGAWRSAECDGPRTCDWDTVKTYVLENFDNLAPFGEKEECDGELFSDGTDSDD